MKVQSKDVTEAKRPAAAEDEVDAGSSLSLVEILQMLNRNKWFVLACVLVGTGIAVLYAKNATRIYEANASFRIDPGRAGSLGLGDIAGGASSIVNQDSGIQTEIAIVRSDTVAVDTLNSLPDNIFAQYAEAEKRTMAFPTDSTSYTPAQEALLGKFKAHLNAKQVEGTQIVNVTFRDPNPKLAAILTNKVVDAYLRQSFDSRYGSVAQVRKWLSTEMETLRTQASDAQRKLAEFQEKNDIFTTEGAGGSSSNTVTDRLAQLNTRVTQAESDRIAKEAQMRAAATGDPAVLASMYPAGPIAGLQAEHVRIYSEIALLSTKFGTNYPPLAELRQQLQRIDAQSDRETRLIRERLRQEYQAATGAENLLRQQYDAQIGKAYALNRQQTEFAVLRAEGESRRTLYETLQIKLQQAGVEAGLSGINTMMVDEARVPLIPVEPKKTAVLSFGLGFGLFAGLAAAFLKEAISDKVQSVEMLERTLGYHILASIPHAAFAEKLQAAGIKDTSPIPPTLISYRDPLSRVSEAYRSMRNSILLSSLDRPAKTVLITSTIPGEGKSITSANYAVVLAQRGSKVLVIDADLRRPTLHKHFGAENLLGLSNLILGENTEGEIMKTPVPELPNLTLITAGKKVPFPSEALGSARLFNILQEWEKVYDYLVLDSAPLLIVSDSMPLAKWADSVVLVSRYNVTPIGALKRLRNTLRHTDVDVTGLVMNDTSGASAGYGEYGYDYYN